MTLVINCLTQKYLFQVSDRRLVRLHDLEVVEDKTIKNVFYCGHWAFSYTGLAEIQGKGTDDWLIDALPSPSKDWVEIIREKATEAFRKVNFPSSMKRHAFVAVGWISLDKDGPRFPTLVLVSNFHSPRGEVLGVTADEFSVSVTTLPQNMPCAIKSVGQPMAQSVVDKLGKNIMRCLKKGTGPTGILRLLVIAMRETAQSNPAVGKNMLALSLPRESAGKPVMAYDGTADDKLNSFLCINEDSSDFSMNPPHVKCGGVIAHNTFDLHIYPDPRRL